MLAYDLGVGATLASDVVRKYIVAAQQVEVRSNLRLIAQSIAMSWVHRPTTRELVFDPNRPGPPLTAWASAGRT